MTRLLIVCLGVVVLVGCQKKDDGRIHLSGNITWKGQPIPAGQLFFSPDVAKGNSGAQGMTAIKNGRFDTSGDEGRPTILGAVIVTVHGFDGVGTTEAGSDGKRLFMPYEMAIEVPADASEIDIVVPDNVKGL